MTVAHKTGKFVEIRDLQQCVKLLAIAATEFAEEPSGRHRFDHPNNQIPWIRSCLAHRRLVSLFKSVHGSPVASRLILIPGAMLDRHSPIIPKRREISPLIDEIARKLLDELQKDARTSYAELGRRVGLSPSATAERLRHLEEAGVIRGYRADIDPSALGLNIVAMIRMVCDGEQYRRFVEFLSTCEEVRECLHVTGSDALMLKVLVGSIEELEHLLMKFLRYGVPTTSIVLSSPLTRTQYRLLDGRPADKS